MRQKKKKKEEIKIMLAKLTQTTSNVYISNDTKMVLKLMVLKLNEIMN